MGVLALFLLLKERVQLSTVDGLWARLHAFVMLRYMPLSSNFCPKGMLDLVPFSGIYQDDRVLMRHSVDVV